MNRQSGPACETSYFRKLWVPKSTAYWTPHAIRALTCFPLNRQLRARVWSSKTTLHCSVSRQIQGAGHEKSTLSKTECVLSYRQDRGAPPFNDVDPKSSNKSVVTFYKTYCACYVRVGLCCVRVGYCSRAKYAKARCTLSYSALFLRLFLVYQPQARPMYKRETKNECRYDRQGLRRRGTA